MICLNELREGFLYCAPLIASAFFAALVAWYVERRDRDTNEGDDR